MRHFNLVEQRATFSGATFTFTDTVAGRLPFSSIAADTGERLWYFAISDDSASWELGTATWNGSTGIVRVDVVNSSASGSPVTFSGAVTVSLVDPAQSKVVADVASQAVPRAEGVNALAVGAGAEAWGNEAVAIGRVAKVGTSSADANNGVALGYQATVTHQAAVAVGLSAQSYFTHGFHARGSILWSGEGFTEDASTVDLLAGGLYPTMPLNSVFAFEAIVVGNRSSTAGGYAAIVRGVLRRGGSGNASFVVAPTVTEIGKTAGVTAVASAAAFTGGEFAITATGEAGEDWDWSVSMHGVRAG